MSGIQDLISQQLSPDMINQISQTIGADPATTQQAVNAAVPMMMGGMAANASTPQGAQQIDAAASQHAGLLDNLGGIGNVLGGLGGMMQGGGSGASGGLGGLGGLSDILSGAGGGILGNILGSNHSDVQDGVTQASGLDRAKAQRLLMILAPIVLAAIARHRSQTGASPTQVSNDLQREAQKHTSNPHIGVILGSILNKATGQA
jgi:hypothetical protein